MNIETIALYCIYIFTLQPHHPIDLQIRQTDDHNNTCFYFKIQYCRLYSVI